jgi:predicted ferric reductase
VRHIEFGVTESYKIAADVLLPDSVQLGSIAEFTESMQINFGIIGFLGLVVLLVCTFFIKFSYQTWLFTHRLLGPAFLISGLHIVYVWSDVRNDLPLRLYLVFWIGIGIAAFVHRSLLGNIFVRRYRYTVSRVSSPVEGVVTIGFEPLKKRVSFKAGQFVFVRFVSGDLKGETHPFSLTGKQGEHDKELEISVKALGDYTQRLQSVKFGDHALIEGAFGRFIPARYPGKKQVWIAGGIGVTPFIASAKAFSTNSAKNVTLFYSVNSETEMIHTDLFRELTVRDPRFSFEGFIAGGANGYLSADYILQKLQTFEDTVFFICGPPVMMSAMKRQLLSKGVSKKNIISEEFSIS